MWCLPENYKCPHNNPVVKCGIQDGGEREDSLIISGLLKL